MTVEKRDLAGDGLMFGVVHCTACGTPPVADVTVTRNSDETLTMNWPDEQGDVTLVAKELLVRIIDEYNRTVTERATIDGRSRTGE